MTEDQIAVLQEAFNIFDKDGSGSVTIDELGQIMKNLGTVTS